MRLNFLMALTLLSFHILSLNQAFGESAYRANGVDYSVYEKRAFSRQGNTKSLLGVSALRSAKLYDEATLPKGTVWRSVEDMQERFELIRDERFLEDPSNPDFPRRISWLYPKDGCYARAALFNRNAFRLYIPIPNKIFAFGNLSVKTPNAARGAVGWWYHVAPMVQVGETKYVLDPSIEASRPLTVKEWLEKMGNPQRIKVAICGSGTYSPGDRCDKETDGLEERAMRTQRHYLSLEKKELQRLGRKIEVELGENPPWE